MKFLVHFIYNLKNKRSQQTFVLMGQIANLLDFAGHLWSLPQILLVLFITPQKGKNHLSSKATQKPVPGRIWPAGHSLPTPDLECQGAWSHNITQTNSPIPQNSNLEITEG